jgi:hypothetical protein
MIKSKKIFALTLLTSLLVMAAFASVIQAQGEATVTMVPSIGGTTDPTGTTTYPADTQVTFTATEDAGYAFVNWIFSSDAGDNVATDNPVTIAVTGGAIYAVQAVFSPILPPPGVGNIPSNLATAAIVVVLAGAGGTVSPPPGTYALADATSLNLQAMPDSGWVFSHWVIAGPNLSHGGYPYTAQPTDNPYTVDHGYGNRFSYQAVFTPEGTTVPTPTIPEFSSIATIIVALALAATGVGTYTFRRRNK